MQLTHHQGAVAPWLPATTCVGFALLAIFPLRRRMIRLPCRENNVFQGLQARFRHTDVRDSTSPSARPTLCAAGLCTFSVHKLSSDGSNVPRDEGALLIW